jgi:hypothetical protein
MTGSYPGHSWRGYAAGHSEWSASPEGCSSAGVEQPRDQGHQRLAPGRREVVAQLLQPLDDRATRIGMTAVLIRSPEVGYVAADRALRPRMRSFLDLMQIVILYCCASKIGNTHRLNRIPARSLVDDASSGQTGLTMLAELHETPIVKGI